MSIFNYKVAFSRNIGWVTSQEQQSLRSKRVAIAGMGGVGGSHLLTHTRLGIGSFHLADMDDFELANFNRQAGASMSTIDQPKVDVMTRMALDINPELHISRFTNGIDLNNLDKFLDGVDIYVDSLDFFAVNIRRAVFAACAERGIPSVTVAPLGMGAAFLCFMPGKMTFEEYFRLEGQPEGEQLLRFFLGLAPSMLQMKYLIQAESINLDDHKGPSTPMACEICAGVAGVNSLKILLNRGTIVSAPWGLHYDAYTNRLKKTWRPWGNNNPLQKLGLSIARKKLANQ